MNPGFQAEKGTIPCWIYRSRRVQEMYLYLAEQEAFDVLPDGLLKRFGQPELVLTLALHPGRRLAREEVRQVMANLQAQGFHLQLPPRRNSQLDHGA